MSSNCYQICTRCVMDTSDSEIIFDKEGVCNHCNKAVENKDFGGWQNHPQGEDPCP